MAIGANSYGSAAGVGALVPRYAGTGGAFSSTTNPTLTAIESYIDSVSGMLNGVLAANGFTIPVSNADVKSMLNLFVNEEVASIAEGINGSGRFGPSEHSAGASRYAMINKDITGFITANMIGFERMGAARNYSIMDGLLTRDSDQHGNPTAPIFQRDGFGNVFQDWDSE